MFVAEKAGGLGAVEGDFGEVILDAGEVVLVGVRGRKGAGDRENLIFPSWSGLGKLGGKILSEGGVEVASVGAERLFLAGGMREFLNLEENGCGEKNDEKADGAGDEQLEDGKGSWGGFHARRLFAIKRDCGRGVWALEEDLVRAGKMDGGVLGRWGGVWFEELELIGYGDGAWIGDVFGRNALAFSEEVEGLGDEPAAFFGELEFFLLSMNLSASEAGKGDGKS